MDAFLASRSRPIVLFGLFATATLAAELALVASRQFPLHPRLFTLAATFDLAVALPAAWWLLVVRPGIASKKSILRAACIGIVVCTLLFGARMRVLAIPIELLLLLVAFRAARAAMNAGGDSHERIRAASTGVLGDNLVARAAATEFSVLYSAFGPGPRQQGFTHGQKAGWSAVAFALGLVTVAEAIPIELWLSRFGAVFTVIAAGLHLYALLWLLGDARALRNRVTRVDGHLLRLRLGLRWQADIPRAAIDSVEIGPAPAGSLRLKILGAPNLVIRLREPTEVRGFLGISRRSNVLAVQVDDPKGLSDALEAS